MVEIICVSCVFGNGFDSLSACGQRMHSSRHAISKRVGGNVVNDYRSSSNDRMLSNALPGKHNCANPNLGEVADFHAASGCATRSKMRIPADPHIVFDDRACVNDYALPDVPIRIYHRCRHDHDAGTDCRAASDNGARMNSVDQLAAELHYPLNRLLALRIVAYSERNFCACVFLQPVSSREYWKIENKRSA